MKINNYSAIRVRSKSIKHGLEKLKIISLVFCELMTIVWFEVYNPFLSASKLSVNILIRSFR